MIGIALKRILCSDNSQKCFTYKVGHCIDNRNSGQDAYFTDKSQKFIGEHELSEAQVNPLGCIFAGRLNSFLCFSQKMLTANWTDAFSNETRGIVDEWYSS